jgi:4-hydroxybenzoyl-CoA thioesterase
MPLENDVFTLVRRVPFGDTDVAGSLYFANVSRYCMEAIEQYFLDRLGIDWYRLNVDRKIGTPFVRADLEFQRAATPRDTLTIRVAIEQLGRSSVLFRVTGYIETAERSCWEGRFKCVFVDAATSRSIAIPDEFRSVMERDAVIAGLPANRPL